jgi:hypothetical protein
MKKLKIIVLKNRYDLENQVVRLGHHPALVITPMNVGYSLVLWARGLNSLYAKRTWGVFETLRGAYNIAQRIVRITKFCRPLSDNKVRVIYNYGESTLYEYLIPKTKLKRFCRTYG